MRVFFYYPFFRYSAAMSPVRRQISPHASRLRRDATEVERRLWPVLRNRQLKGAKFRRQATLGRYIVDFLCVESRLIVELDGGQHGDEADAARTAWLEAEGFRVLRFWNHEVIETFDGVIAVIAAALKKEEEEEEEDPHPALSRLRERVQGKRG